MNRTAIVTGGTGAIGSAICRALLAAGCRVGAIGHPSEAGRLEPWRAGFDGEPPAVELADLGDHDAAGAAVRRLEAGLGAVDVLVNAAGITRDARFARMTPEAWREVLAANLDSAFNACHAVFAGMCDRGFGRIVNISSVNGQKGQFGQANYSASKAGLHGLSMALAQEGARYNVTVNTVSPGYIDTPMVAAIKPEARAAIEAQIPMRRLGRPEEIARVVAFLCDPDSAYITGVNLPVNGGLFISH